MNPIQSLLELLHQKKLTGIFIKGAASIRYFTGFTGGDSLLYIDNTKQIIITDSRYTLQVKQEAPGCQVLEHTQGLWSEADKVGACGIVGIDGNYFSYTDWQQLSAALPQMKWQSVDLTPLRQLKTAEELSLIKQAVAISDEAFEQLLPHIGAGRQESELAAELEYNMRRLGSERAAFATIVASGERSALPHGIASDKIVAAGDFVTFDFGAVYHGYRSDITRTVVVGTAAPWQKEIYDIVLQANLLGEATVKAGVTGQAVDKTVRDYITEQGYGQYFGHGLGHGVGLDIHECPVLNKRDTTVLRPNAVVTVEPGIYIPTQGGVRIEDTVVVTETGCQVLTSVAKQLFEIH